MRRQTYDHPPALVAGTPTCDACSSTRMRRPSWEWMECLACGSRFAMNEAAAGDVHAWTAAQPDPAVHGEIPPGVAAAAAGTITTFITLDGAVVLNTVTGTVTMGANGGSVAGCSTSVETVGQIDRRITATRIVTTGVLALAWRKKKDNRELYLTVDGAEFEFVARIDPHRSTAARRFAADITTAGRPGVTG